jgi:hypothetical protein
MALLGRKVSIRFVLRGDPDHPFSEAIGVVMSTDPEPGVVTILGKNGEKVDVAVRDILATKVFP